MNLKLIYFAIAIILLTICLVFPLHQAIAQDYFLIDNLGVQGFGVYYDEMFTGKVNPAAVGFLKESLRLEIQRRIFRGNPTYLLGEYNTNRLHISAVYARDVRVSTSFENDEIGELYDYTQIPHRFLFTAASFNIRLGSRIRLGLGQQLTHFREFHFENEWNDFSLEHTGLGVDIGSAAMIWRNVYLSAYARNALYLNLSQTSEDRDMELKFDFKQPLVLGSGISIAIAQLVANFDVIYMPELGESPGVRCNGFYTFFIGDRHRLKVGAGGETVADSYWRDTLKLEGVVSFWISDRLTLKYAAGLQPEELSISNLDYGRGRLYQQFSLGWLWE